MFKRLPRLVLILLLIGFAFPLWAGTQVKARLESLAYKDVWVDVDMSIGDGHLRLNFKGPYANGSVIYDEKTSLLTLIDEIDHCAIPINRTDQEAFEFMGKLGAGRIKSALEGSKPTVQMAYQLMTTNVCALFNGESVLQKKGIRKDGFVCDDYQTDLNGAKSREAWITFPSPSTLSQEDYDTLRSLISLGLNLFGSVLENFGAQVDSYQPPDRVQLPVHLVLDVEGKPSSRFKIYAIRPRDCGPNDFEPPAGYPTLNWLDLIQQGIKGNS